MPLNASNCLRAPPRPRTWHTRRTRGVARNYWLNHEPCAERQECSGFESPRGLLGYESAAKWRTACAHRGQSASLRMMDLSGSSRAQTIGGGREGRRCHQALLLGVWVPRVTPLQDAPVRRLSQRTHAHVWRSPAAAHAPSRPGAGAPHRLVSRRPIASVPDPSRANGNACPRSWPSERRGRPARPGARAFARILSHPNRPTRDRQTPFVLACPPKTTISLVGWNDRNRADFLTLAHSRRGT